MFNAWKLAAAAALGGLAGAHDEAAQVVQAVVEPKPAPAVTAKVEPLLALTQDRRVTVNFDQATVNDVFDWFAVNGVNFVAAESEVDRAQKISLNVKDQPLEDVLEAIADALGGHWEQRGQVKVFKKGGGLNVFATPSVGRAPLNLMVPRARTPVLPKDMDVKFQGDMRKFEGDMKLFEKEMQSHLKELNKELPKIREKAMSDALRAHGDAKVKVWTDKDEKALRIEIERAMKDAHKAMEEAHKVYKLRGEMKVPDVKVVVPDVPNLYEFHRGDRVKALAPDMSVMRLEKNNIKKLMESLTIEQRDLHNRQGHLKARDLTAAQRRLLGIGDQKGDWTLSYKMDGRAITIKSD